MKIVPLRIGEEPRIWPNEKCIEVTIRVIKLPGRKLTGSCKLSLPQSLNEEDQLGLRAASDNCINVLTTPNTRRNPF